ncbi:MAG: hypothetical protein QGI70_04655, partial [Paracoccaceae bacterium]|nr:hypothetical protein [Paracoccaceae bacterium]
PAYRKSVGPRAATDARGPRKIATTTARRWAAKSTFSFSIFGIWGALGGATNALTTKMRLRDALRHILLGGLIAAGMGSLSMAVITSWLGLPPQAIPAGGAAGSAAYLVGVFGPAVIELVLARLRHAREGGDD